jgi:hypothetical protein
MVKRVTAQLVCNYVVSPEIREITKKEILESAVSKKFPVPIDLQLETTIDVLARIIELERKSGQGRRYGHPILDVAREVNRYFFPTVHGTRGLGVDTENVKADLVAKFLRAIGRGL